jgi:hypothetical protein
MKNILDSRFQIEDFDSAAIAPTPEECESTEAQY